MISSIQYLPGLIITAASPSEGSQIINKYYQPQAATEKSKLTQHYHRFRMEANESRQSYFGRFAVLRSQLASDGTIFIDTDANHHLVRNLSPAFRKQKSILLAQSGLSMQVVEEVGTSAYGEMEIEREEDASNETRYACVVSGTGRGGGGGQNGGRRNDGGGSGRRQG